MDTLQSTVGTIPRFDIAIVWILVLVVSALPDIIWNALAGRTPVWLFWTKIGVLIIAIILGSVWMEMLSLRSFFVLLLLLVVGLKVMNWVRARPSYLDWRQQSGWALPVAASLGMKLLSMGVMAAALLAMGRRTQDFFLATGDLEKWKGPGIMLALFIMVSTFFFFRLRIPSKSTFLKALPWIPLALLFAAISAFYEEMQFRAMLLPALHTVGKYHSITITAVLFGLAHYFGGSPPGVAGVLVTAALGWLFAICMFETGGILMPWFMHFLTNAVTFSFVAIGSYSW